MTYRCFAVGAVCDIKNRQKERDGERRRKRKKSGRLQARLISISASTMPRVSGLIKFVWRSSKMAGEKAARHSLWRRRRATGRRRRRRRCPFVRVSWDAIYVTSDTFIRLQRAIRSSGASVERAFSSPSSWFSPGKAKDSPRGSQSRKDIFSGSFTPTEMTRRVVNGKNLKKEPLRSHEDKAEGWRSIPKWGDYRRLYLDRR